MFAVNIREENNNLLSCTDMHMPPFVGSYLMIINKDSGKDETWFVKKVIHFINHNTPSNSVNVIVVKPPFG